MNINKDMDMNIDIFKEISHRVHREHRKNKSFSGGPGGRFFKKAPLAAGGKKIFFLFISLLFLSMGLFSQSTGISGDATINQCETKSYTISIQNNSGNDLTSLVVTGELGNLTGFSYVSSTSSIDVDGGGAFCTVDPTPSGSDIIWDIDASCPGSPFTLADGETLNITFSLSTNCSAVSGSLNTTIEYDILGAPSSDTGLLNIQVNPGAVTIKKTPNVIPQYIGQNVTWTITVENTGFGIIENVEITDVLGAGLSYISSTQGGSNAGQTTTWTSNEYAALASMDPGDILTMDITAQVIACNNLDNVADVRFGCDPSPTNTCFNTSTDGGTARASVQHLVRTPVIAFTPPDIDFTYCDDTAHVSFIIHNNGDGYAYNVHTIVDFSSFNVTNISSGATYTAATNRFELADPLAPSGSPGDSYNLSFDLEYSSWCGSGFPSGDLLWQKLYYDECGQEFYPPVELSAINSPSGTTGLTVTKTGAPSQIEIGGTINYAITSSYTGPNSCGTPLNPAGTITVVDTVPAGITVSGILDGGVWDNTAPPTGNGTSGGTITWTYTPPATLNTTFTAQVPSTSECETYCDTVFTNTVNASGSDCCGCPLTASASQTTAIECAEGVTSEKTSTSPTERCTDTTFTNTYVFSGGSAVNLNDLVFTEQAENQQVYNGSLSILLDGGPVAGVTVNDTTPGGNLELDFSGAAATPLAGRTLVITYNLTATANTIAACGGSTFYSWSALNMGASGSQCLGDGVIHEATEVSVGSPSMSVSVTGLGQIYHTCETKTITMTVTQTSNFNPKDVQVVLSGLNYFVVNPGSTVCGGTVSPVSCTPTLVGDDYVWDFADGFTANGSTATIQLQVQKRCTGGGALDAVVYWDDLCTDDATYDHLCSASGTETPALLLVGDLLIEKTPETYYAVSNLVQWEIYITNRGTGSAYNVWVDDVLGSGLIYEHGVNPAVVDNMTGVTINDSLDHSGGAINGASIEIAEMTAGERRQITFYAKQIDCNNLTNDVTANWGCIGVDCQTAVTDSSTVTLPAPNLINTNTVTPSGGVDACSSPDGFVTLRNAGQVTCYNLQVTETLPPNLLYVSGSTRWRLNGGIWNGPNAAYDPNPTTSPLVWTSTEIPGLATADPGDTIEIEFSMTADCPFTGGSITCDTQYENPCADVFSTAQSVFTATFNAPDIELTKTRANTPIDCSDAIQWTITVTNNSTYTLPIVWVEDTLDAAYTYASSVGDPPFTSDNGTNVGQVITWELQNVNPGDTVTLTLNVTTDSSPCSSDLDNTVIAYWGCGVADGNSSTKPGVDAPDDSLCISSTGVTDVRTETREPTMSFLNIAISPLNIDSCNDSTQLTIVMENTGPTDAYTLDLAMTLPTGITYNSGTAEMGVGTDTASATAAIGAIGDPSISGSTITFYDQNDKGNNITPTLQADGGNDTLVLRFTVQSACYVTDDVDYELFYYDCCDDVRYSATTSETLTALDPDLAITKVASAQQVACGGNVQYTIQVTNNGTGNAEVIRVVDTLGNWLDYAGNFTEDQPGTITPANISGNPQVIGWEFNNLGPGATATFTFEATLNPDGLPNQNDCTAALRENNASVQWACGTTGDAVDDNPNTTGYDCTASGSTNATAVVLEMPNLVVTSITPQITCSSDGSFSGTVTARVTNNGDGDTSGTFTVQVTDGKGWTGTGTYSSAIAAGAYADVTINAASWVPSCHACAAPYTFNATVDLNNDICECNETDNTTGSATSYTAPIAELTVTDIDFTNVSCSGDSISGNVRVTIENTGCSAATNFNVSLTTDGCLTFTPQNVASLAAETSTTLTFNISGSLASCTDSSCDFTATVDTSNNVCECDGTNNTRTETYTSTLPDLTVTDIDFSNVSCANDAISGFVRVTVQNQGFGSAGNFQVSLATDGCLTFAANQTVVGPLTNGQTATVDFTISGSWSNCADCSCDFTATVDPGNTICECDGSNNTLGDTYSNPLPKLQVNSVTSQVSCSGGDNPSGSVQVGVSNTGCAAASGVVVRLTSSCGHTFSDQTVNLSAGGSNTLTFNFTPSCTDCACTFTAEIDPDNAICECNNTSHSVTSAAVTNNVPDLEVTADTLAVGCNADGQINVSGNITLANNGCGSNYTTNTPVRFTLYDNTGCTSGGGSQVAQWTETLTGVNISAGGSQNIAISETITTDMVSNSTNCQYSIYVEADPNDVICECDGTNNTYCADNKTVDIPNVQIQGHSVTITETDDGQVTITGSFTVENSGCGSNLTTDIPVRFTLFDNTGCSGNQLRQWTQTLTSVNIPAGGGTQVFTLTTQNLTANMVDSSDNCRVSLLIEPDYNLSICESSGSDNNYCADNITIDIPDLEVQADALVFGCVADGEPRVSGSITIANTGCGSNVTDNIDVRFTLFDDASCSGSQVDQWTETFSSVNIPAMGGTQTFTITTRDFIDDLCSIGTNCQMSIRVEIDYNNTIWESDGTDNTLCGTKDVQIPDLTITSVGSTITCLNDGNLTGTTVTVANTGCGTATNAVVRLVSDCGLTFADKTVTIPSGESRDVLFLFTSGLTNCSCEFTATVDPDDTICECNGTNNTMTGTSSMTMPDIEIQSQAFSVNCADDGMVEISGSVTLLNNGCGGTFTTNVPMRITLYGGSGATGTQIGQWTQTFTGVSLAPGSGTQTFTIQPYQVAADVCSMAPGCQMSVRVEADYNDDICEWDGTDNIMTTNVSSNDCIDPQAAQIVVSTNCTEDGVMNGTVAVTVTNGGSSPITDDFYVRVDDGRGWNAERLYNEDLGGTLPLAGGASATVTFNWDRDFSSTELTCEPETFTAVVDARNQLCQCNSENDTITSAYQLEAPNVRPTLITCNCSEDGYYTLQVTMENTGCAPAGSFTLHMEDSLGNSRDVTIDGLAVGANITQDITLWPATCSPANVTFTATVDSGAQVCETTGTDNTMTYEYTNPSPDITITEINPTANCTSDGRITGSIEVKVRNDGNSPVTDDFKITVDDGQGWNGEYFYQSDLGGSLPINVGTEVSTGIPWNRSFGTDRFTCYFSNIVVGIDMEAGVCECGMDNNESTTSFGIGYPDLALNDLQARCYEDGKWEINLTITNSGCGDVDDDFNILFTDSTGQNRTVSFTSIGGTLPFKTGQTQTVTLVDWPYDGSVQSVTITAEIRMPDGGCDMNPANNTVTVTHTDDSPDLTIADIDWVTNSDGTVTFTVTIGNDGNGPGTNVPFVVYDQNGNPVYQTTVTVPAGGSVQVTFTTGALTPNQPVSYRFVVDENNEICESGDAVNIKITEITPEETGDPGLTIKKFCPPGQHQGGLFRFENKVQNTGSVDLTNVTIQDILPPGFTYVPGSSIINGQPVGDPVLGPVTSNGQTVTWVIPTLTVGQEVTVVFMSVPAADTDPGSYCILAQSWGFTGANGTGSRVDTDQVQCCTVVTNRAGAGCCLQIDEWAMGAFHRPEGPMSFIEPYFHTESAMFTVYAALNLWKNAPLEEGTMPAFMRERLVNYARSNIEEFYLGSGLGITNEDGTLRLAMAGAYPEKNKDKHNRWFHKQVDETMTLSQMGFELLALKETLAVETRTDVKATLKRLIEEKLAFIARYKDDLPHGWEIKEKGKDKKKDSDKNKSTYIQSTDTHTEYSVDKTDADAGLYDRAALYLAMVEMSNAGYTQAGELATILKKDLETIDDNGFDRVNVRQELIFILALLKNGHTEQAKSKITHFEELLSKERSQEEHGEDARSEDGDRMLKTLHDYALAAYVDKLAGGTKYDALFARMKERFYLEDTGIFAGKQPDFTFKLDLHDLAPLMLSFDTKDPGLQEEYATILYRTFDEVGLFLKKRNLAVGKPLYSMLKNYPFAEPFLPVLSFTKANRTIAPVFSRNAVVHSTQAKPLGEVQIPNVYSKILSPAYETDVSRIATVSYGLQHMGGTLAADSQRVIKEEGRSLNDKGQRYIDALLTGGAGYQMYGATLLPFDHLAVKGPKQGKHNLEPYNSVSTFSSAVLADYMTAEKLYLDNKGKQSATVGKLMALQDKIISKFKEVGYVPATFRIYIDEASGSIDVHPSTEKASKITTAKFFHVLPKDKAHGFLKGFLKKSTGKLEVEDLIFLATAPELVEVFKKDLEQIIDYKDSKITYNAADIIARRLLGRTDGIDKSLENLLKNWDKEAVLPKSDRIDNIEKGLIYNHEPRHFLLYLAATHGTDSFRFKRTLNFFTYLLENEWGIEWGKTFISFPSLEYRVFKEEPRQKAEPGDLVNFKVHVDNTCPEGIADAFDLSALFLKATFNPPLVYMGTYPVEGLESTGDFKWRYNGLPEGSQLDYMYQAFIPYDYVNRSIDGRIFVSGRQGYQDYGPESASGDYCEDTAHVSGLDFEPYDEKYGVVFEDRNVNGIKDGGEPGIAGIQFKDTRGRMFRSNAEGRFTILAGDEHEGIQMELKSLPANYILYGKPTQLVNRRYVGEIYFPLIPCENLEGFVYVDANGNGTYDDGEPRPGGVLLKSKDKEVMTGSEGKFIFRNLPVLWAEWLEVVPTQPFFKGEINKLKIQLPGDNK